MKDMKKDGFIEEKIDSYVEGTSPDVDLSAAKRALSEEHARRRSAGRKKWIAPVSACACLLLVAAVLIGVLPSFIAGGDKNNGMAGIPGEPPGGQSGNDGDPSGGSEPCEFYELSGAEQRTASIGELLETYGGKTGKLTALGLSSNVRAGYTLYFYGDSAVLLEADLLYSQLGRRVSATVYADLSGGKYRAAELGEYETLPSEYETYTFKKTFLNGEYAYLGNFSAQDTEYCVSLQSSYENAFFSFMEYLT